MKRTLSATFVLSSLIFGLSGCGATPPTVSAPAAAQAAPASGQPAPQPPFDLTPITPVETAGASA